MAINGLMCLMLVLSLSLYPSLLFSVVVVPLSLSLCCDFFRPKNAILNYEM